MEAMKTLDNHTVSKLISFRKNVCIFTDKYSPKIPANNYIKQPSSSDTNVNVPALHCQSTALNTSNTQITNIHNCMHTVQAIYNGWHREMYIIYSVRHVLISLRLALQYVQQCGHLVQCKCPWWSVETI